MSDHPSKLATIEFPTSLWIKYPIPWCWNTFLGDNNFGGGKKGTSSQIDGTLGLRKDTLLFPIFCFKRKLARKICYIYWTSEISEHCLSQKWGCSFVSFSLRGWKVSCSGESNNGRTMGSWHSALFAALTQNHQTSLLLHFLPPPSSRTDYLTDTLPFGAEKYTRNTPWYRMFWDILVNFIPM